MKLIIFSLLLVLFGCGVSSSGKGNDGNKVPTPFNDKYKSVYKAKIVIGVSDNAVSVVYVSPANDTFTIDETAIVPTLSGDTLTLDLGDIVITALSTNRTKICGTGSQQCTSAIIRTYNEELVGYEGIAGFINKTDSYSVDVLVEDSTSTTPDNTIGLGVANQVILEEFTITNEKKVNLTNFPDASYALQVDFSNAGAGSYEMTIIVELALGL